MCFEEQYKIAEKFNEDNDDMNKCIIQTKKLGKKKS